jgi:hypothetical protein
MGEDLHVWSVSPGWGDTWGSVEAIGDGYGVGVYCDHGGYGYGNGHGDGCGEYVTPHQLVSGNGLGGGFDFSTVEGNSFYSDGDGSSREL